MAEKEYYTDADWRYQIVVRTSEPSEIFGKDNPMPAGVVGKGVGFVGSSSQPTSFGIPNATALFLNLSKRYYDEAYSIGQKHTSSKDLRYFLDNDNEAFSYFENIMASVVFSYTSLESFANEEIPEDFVFSIDRGKCVENYNKIQIEKSLSLVTKLGDILPLVFKIKSPKGTKIWEGFIKLEKLRHSIIHMKVKDREHKGFSSTSVWSQLLKKPIPYAISTVKNMIDYFYKSKTLKPHWYNNFPY